MSTLLRRIHMYAGLFLAPWVLMYALSTVAMNHRDHLGTKPPVFTRDFERPYKATFSADTAPAQQAEQILHNLDMEGAYSVGKPRADGTLVIQRLNLLRPARVTYSPASGTVLVESAAGSAPSLLERMHRRRGSAQCFVADKIWGLIVEAFIVLSVVWVLTGLWLWWELKMTRRFGALCLVGGLSLFVFFLAAI